MKPKWEKWKGEKKADYEKRLAEWEGDEQEAQESVYQHVTKRACAKCALWVPYANSSLKEGQCSLGPKWLVTNPEHYCGSWRKEI